MHVSLRDSAFDPWAELAAYQQERLAAGAFGATAAFVGTMRDFNEGSAVRRLFLEHYPGMTERELERLAGAALETHELLDVLVIHRVGAVEPADPIVLVAAWSAHRAAAFAACRELMEALKSTAPFWKHEETDDGGRWVRHNTPG